MYTYRPRGVCSRAINIELDGERISHVDFEGGCAGNLQAISKLVSGMNVDEVAGLLEGNRCGRRPTSCTDQLVHGLRAARAEAQAAASA